MAEQELHSLASAFPNPPPFWRDFTPDRIAQMEELSKSYMDTLLPGDIADSSVVMRVPDVPEELIHLQPPAEPEDGRWRVFGDLYKVCTNSCFDGIESSANEYVLSSRTSCRH